MWMMMQNEKPENYVIATGESRTIKEFLTAAFNVVGIDDWKPYVKINPKFFRPNEVEFLQGKPTKAMTELGWYCKYNFEDLVTEMVKSDIELTE